MALKTRFRRSLGIDDCIRRATTFDMRAPCAVTSFAPDVLGMFRLNGKPRMGSRAEPVHNRAVTLGALLAPHELGVGDLRRCN